MFFVKKVLTNDKKLAIMILSKRRSFPMKQNNEGLNKAATISAKIMEVCHWVAVGLLAASLLAYLFDKTWLKVFIDVGSGEFAVSGYSVKVLDNTGDRKSVV